jgi:SagB-type dehydrogenase family enzyme
MISSESLPEAVPKASRVSQVEMQYPALLEIHEKSDQIVKASSPLPNMLSQTGISPQLQTKLSKPDNLPEIMNFTEMVMRRRSMRNFVSAELPKAHFDALLNFLCQPESEDNFQESCVSMGFLAGNAEGLEPGCYWINRAESAISLSKEGFLINEMTRICLDQEWLSQAALHFFFVANLEWLEENLGPRGYRYAMLIAGQLGQKIYMGATALGLGACGIGAFYDDEASALLELNDSSAMLYLVAAGPVKRLFTGKTP